MRRHILMTWLVTAMPVAAACGGSSSNATQIPQLATGDASGFAALFMDDGIEIMPAMPPTQGPEAVRKEYTTVAASMKDLQITLGEAVVTIADAGDLAVVKAPDHMTYTGPKVKKAEDHGTSMTAFKKVNGQWKVLCDTNISEVAPQ